MGVVAPPQKPAVADRLRAQDHVDLDQAAVLEHAELDGLAGALCQALEGGPRHGADVELAERRAAEGDEGAAQAERAAQLVAGNEIVARHGREQPRHRALVEPEPPPDLHDAQAPRMALEELEDLDRLAHGVDRTRAAGHRERIAAAPLTRQPRRCMMGNDVAGLLTVGRICAAHSGTCPRTSWNASPAPSAPRRSPAAPAIPPWVEEDA